MRWQLLPPVSGIAREGRTLAEDRRGILEMRRHGPGRLPRGRPDVGGDLDPALRVRVAATSAPRRMLVPDNEREWGTWLRGYRTVGQEVSIRFKPLHEVVDEPYTLYFPVSASRNEAV